VSVLVVGGSSSSSASTDLAWTPPTLQDPSVVLVSEANRELNLPTDRDFAVKMPPHALTGAGGLKITGGRNVVIVGGSVSISDLPDTASIQARRGLLLKGQTGTVHIEGMQFSGNSLTEGIQIAAPDAIVQLQNIRVERLRARDEVNWTDNHPDVVQPWGGVKQLRIDKLTGTTPYQGLFLKADSGTIGAVDLRRININGTETARYIYWSSGLFPLTGADLWYLPGATRTASTSLQPRLPDLTWAAATNGRPPTGDFVPAGTVGAGYTSPFVYPTPPALTVTDTTKSEPRWSTEVRSAELVVTLNKPSGAKIKVSYTTVNDTALSGQDYTSKSGELVFEAGQTSKTVWVPIAHDGVAEGTERYLLRLSSPVNATLARSPAAGSIVDG
jgi:hypothetical protein